jgi:hypothetical protein
VEKRRSGLDVRFSAWTKSFATQRQMVSFASIRPSVHPSATRRSGEAVKWRSGKVEKRSSGLDKVPAGAKAGTKAV